MPNVSIISASFLRLMDFWVKQDQNNFCRLVQVGRRQLSELQNLSRKQCEGEQIDRAAHM